MHRAFPDLRFSALPLSLGAALLSGWAASAHGPGGGADIPPPQGAHSGQCFAKVREPDAVTVDREPVLVRPAGAYARVIPAVTRTVDKTVMVRPASEAVVTHPAVFRTVWKTVTERGAMHEIDTPARYRTVSESVLISPERTVWRRGAGQPVMGTPGDGQTAYQATGEILCRVTIPARYAVGSRVVQIAPAAHRTIQGPTVSHHVSERVQVSPERVEHVHRPAVTRTVRETVVVTPARTVTVHTPAVWRTVERTRAEPRYGWQPIVCAHPEPPVRPAPPMRAAPWMEQPYSLPTPHEPYGERG